MGTRRRVLDVLWLVIGSALVGVFIAYATGSAAGVDESALQKEREAVYLDAMRDDFPGGSDAELLEAGYAVCDLYDGRSWVEVVEALTDGGEMSAEDAGSAATTAVVLCPEHADKLP